MREGARGRDRVKTPMPRNQNFQKCILISALLFSYDEAVFSVGVSVFFLLSTFLLSSLLFFLTLASAFFYAL